MLSPETATAVQAGEIDLTPPEIDRIAVPE
jgi:hypothetical protein